MRRFAYNEPSADFSENTVVVVTEQDILDQYWDFWSDAMLHVHKSPMITKENCLQDFVVVNWAWELPES
jgi:hypothetical protein